MGIDLSERLRRPPEEQSADVAERVAREGCKSFLPLLTLWPGFAVLAALFDRATPTMFERRVTVWLSDAQLAINELRRRGVDVDALKDDPKFVDFVADATAAAMRTHREEKRTALRNAIINSAMPTSPSETKARVFLRLVDELDAHHLLLLDLLANPSAFLSKRGVPFPGRASDPYIERDELTMHQSPRSLLSIVRRVLPSELPEDLHDLALQDLNRRGLVASGTTFSTLCTGKSLASQLGFEFVQFIAEPPEPATASEQ